MKQLTALEKEFTSRRQSLFIATAAVKKSTNTPVGGKDIAGPPASMGGKTHCNLCGTNESPQWRSWRGFHCCNACGIKAWRHYDSTYYKPVPGKRTASLATLTAKDKQGGQDLLQYLKDIGEL